MTSTKQIIDDLEETAEEFRDEDAEGNLIDKCFECLFPLDEDEQFLCTLCAESVRERWVDKPRADMLD